MVILGVDPGYAIVGYGVVSYEKSRFTPLTYGAVTTPAGMESHRRLQLVYEGICQVLDTYHPAAMSVEQLFFTNNRTTGIMVAQARGVILLAATQRGVPIYEYGPLQVKQSVVGYGKAVKSQVMEMTRVILGLEKIPKPDDAADALAIAICHAHTAGSLVGSTGLAAAIAASDRRDAHAKLYRTGPKSPLKAGPK